MRPHLRRRAEKRWRRQNARYVRKLRAWEWATLRNIGRATTERTEERGLIASFFFPYPPDDTPRVLAKHWTVGRGVHRWFARSVSKTGEYYGSVETCVTKGT